MASDDAPRSVHARIPYVTDKEIHVSSVQSPADGSFVDCREYIPSLDAYGRGLTFPTRLLDQFLEGLHACREENAEDIQATTGKGGK